MSGRRASRTNSFRNGLSGNDYLDAAREHVLALPSLYGQGRHSLTIYASGLATECLFRAFRSKKGLPFQSDHKLAVLAEEAGFPELIPAHDRERFDAALSELIVAWRSVHRFYSEEAMRRFLKSVKLDRGIKGSFVKELARRLSSSAIELVSLGEQQWTSS